MTRVCHLSSAHNGLDSRIFYKECISLAEAGFETHLIISATQEDVLKARDKSVTLHAVPETSGRFSRVMRKTWRCWRLARHVNAKIYHFHDPELIPVGIALSLMGKKVIYDVHEDLPKDILSKHWIAPPLRKSTAWVAAAVEYVGAKTYSCVVTATPFLKERFEKHSKQVITIKNYPRFNTSIPPKVRKADAKHVCYIGSISKIRGIEEICQAVELAETNPHLLLAGKFSEPDVYDKVSSLPCWDRVDYRGLLDHDEVAEVLACSSVGLVTLHPIVNFKDALPIKLFEYMQAELAVISSDFPLWREIIESCDCGILVDPRNPKEIAEAIDYLARNPDIARRMGQNGRKAALKVYNWETEEAALIALYKELAMPQI